jgi:hypothetical protein
MNEAKKYNHSPRQSRSIYRRPTGSTYLSLIVLLLMQTVRAYDCETGNTLETPGCWTCDQQYAQVIDITNKDYILT